MASRKREPGTAADRQEIRNQQRQGTADTMARDSSRPPKPTTDPGAGYAWAWDGARWYRKNVSSGSSSSSRTTSPQPARTETESDRIYNQMSDSEKQEVWRIFNDVSSGRISSEEAARQVARNESRVRGVQPPAETPGAGTGLTQPAPIEEAPAEKEVLSPAPVVNQTTLFQGLATYLRGIGLGSLFSYEGGKPSGWLWEQIKAGVQTQDELLFALEQTPEFQQRFSVIFKLRETPGAYVPSAREVLDYEKGFNELMIGSGVPSWFYDSYDDAQNAMSRGLSLTQVEGRLERGFQTMRRMPTEVRDVFAEYYGEQADNALLAAILDPQKTLDEIDRSVRTAQIAGFGREVGLAVGRAQAERLGGIQMTESQIRQGIQASAALRPLTQETLGEAVDLTEAQAVEAGLGQSAIDQQLLENRLRTRQLQQANIGGGASVSAQGVLGAGVV